MRRDEAPLGAPVWIDVFTSDPETSKAFYAELFGWRWDEPDEEFGGYTNARLGEVLVAGLMTNHGDSQAPDMWSVYLATDDAERVVADTEARGGQVFVPAMPVGDLGVMAVFADPSGATIGTWQPGTHAGFGVLAEPGAPAWFELHTTDYDAALAYYRDVFGWDAHEMANEPGFRYTTLGANEAALAGVMDAASLLPEGVASSWSIYFSVVDTDDALAQAVELGASVVDRPEDTPYGRLAGLADPTGAHFKLMGPGA